MPNEPRPAMQGTEALLRSLLESSRDGIMALTAVRDSAGRIADFEWVAMNRRATELLGRDEGTLKGLRLLNVIPGYRADGLYDRYVSVVETGTPIDIEHYYAHGSARAWFRTIAVKSGDGLVVTFADLSEPKRLEEQLRHSQKMEVVGRLAGGIAHDFNNLLTAIGVNAELALEALPPGQPGRVEAEAALDSVRRARTLTHQLLAFARKQTVIPRVLAFDDLIRHAAPMLRRLLGNDIEFVSVPSDEPWSVLGDPGTFEQVLTNLAVNSHDAMPNGGRFTLEVSNVVVRADDGAGIRHVPEGEYVRLEAHDTGVGIAPEILPHVFEPFFTTKSADRGTGLGLATSYGIVRQAGGHIWVTSTQGRGSTFTVLLPRAYAAAQPWPALAPAVRPSKGSEHVLVVDDEPSVRTVVSRTLGRLGYRTAAAGNGDEALRMIEGNGFDLVLTDIVMPLMGGRELLRLGRERYPQLPMLLMSGYELEATSDDEGPLLKKPFSAAELARAVRDALDRAAA
jgi:signal transduction histidine kinase